MENIEHLIEEAESRGWKPQHAPYLDMKVQGGWVVDGIGDYRDLEGGGKGWTHFGWVFDNEADAKNFYNHFKNKESAATNKQTLDKFFSQF